jgi:hypothetical protein
MSGAVDKIVLEIEKLPDLDKLHLVDTILMGLDKPDPEIDRAWAIEARRRWEAFKNGQIPTVSYAEVLAKHRAS